MPVLNPSAQPHHAPAPLLPIPAGPQPREPIEVTWCRQITSGVAATLNTAVLQAGYRLTSHPGLPLEPQLLHTTFTARGHQVAVTVVFDQPYQDPAYHLTIDDSPIPVDTTGRAAPATVLVHAVCHAITTVRGR